jgi:hypothetical protein
MEMFTRFLSLQPVHTFLHSRPQIKVAFCPHSGEFPDLVGPPSYQFIFEIVLEYLQPWLEVVYCCLP